MTLFEKISLGLVGIGAIGMYRKLYFGSKVKSKNKKAEPDILFRRIYSIPTLFPINKNNCQKEDWYLVKKSNAGLLIIYIAFIIIAILAILQVKFNVKV